MSNSKDSFTAGMTLGVCVGVAGYFLFGTEKGKKVREELGGIWDEVKHDSDLLPEKLKDMHFGGLLEEVVGEVHDVLNVVSEAAHETEKKPRKRRKATIKSAKFTGVRAAKIKAAKK